MCFSLIFPKKHCTLDKHTEAERGSVKCRGDIPIFTSVGWLSLFTTEWARTLGRRLLDEEDHVNLLLSLITFVPNFPIYGW
jgi:hypothetical protein